MEEVQLAVVPVIFGRAEGYSGGSAHTWGWKGCNEYLSRNIPTVVHTDVAVGWSLVPAHRGVEIQEHAFGRGALGLGGTIKLRGSGDSGSGEARLAAGVVLHM